MTTTGVTEIFYVWHSSYISSIHSVVIESKTQNDKAWKTAGIYQNLDASTNKLSILLLILLTAWSLSTKVASPRKLLVLNHASKSC